MYCRENRPYIASSSSHVKIHILKMPRLPDFLRGRAIGLLDENVPVKEIARRMGVAPNAIRKLRTKFQVTGEVKNQPRTPRGRVTSVRQDMSIVNLAETSNESGL